MTSPSRPHLPLHFFSLAHLPLAYLFLAYLPLAYLLTCYLPMITLYPVPDLPRFKPGRPPANSRKTTDDFAPNNPHQAKAEARRILSAGLSPQAWRSIDLLATGGVLSAERLGSFGTSERTLQRLAKAWVLERLVRDGDEVRRSLEGFGLESKQRPNLYTLGPVGIEIATGRHDVPPPSGYQGYSLSRVLHDVITNEIVLRLAEAIGAGWTVEWLGKYEGTLTDKAQKQVLLEPDALIRFRKDGEERALLLEYHNEDKRSRAALKVEKYEAAFNEGNWRERWEVETFPPVLAVFHQPIVGVGYKSAVEGKRLHCAYYGKTLKAVLDGKLDEWVNVASSEKETILPKDE